MIDEALAGTPDSVELRMARASTLMAWGRHHEARELLKEIEKYAPAGAFHQKLGLAAFWTGHFQESERSMRLALAENPTDWQRHFGLGLTLQAVQKNDDAAASLARALELNPDDKHCLANLIACELDLQHVRRCEDLARHAVKMHPNSAIAWSNLGVVLDHRQYFAEALVAFDHAEQLSHKGGEDQALFLNHAICHLRAGRTQAGIALLEHNLCKNPNAQAHCHYSLALLSAGRMREGWEQYDFRWLDGPLKESRANFPKPMWIGQDLAGKTILIRAEQGFGDFFQFIRYAPHVKALGAKVLLQITEAVREVAQNVAGVDRILRPDEPYPPFDFHANLLSLPRIFDTTTSNIPGNVPYLSVDKRRREKWAERLPRGTALRIGLVWAGSGTHLRDEFRSISLEMLAPLQTLPGVQFYSLQKGDAGSDAKRADAPLAMIDLEAELQDFADTAAAIDELDLVISVDTAVAHLAGSLGKPVWVMLPVPCDWRWLETGEGTLWYPTMRLFRQTTQGKWSDTVLNIRQCLDDVLQGRVALRDLSRRPLAVSALLSPNFVESANPKVSAATYGRAGYLQYFPDSVVGRSLRLYGEYLQPHLDLLTRFIGSGSVAMEIGSGTGAHAVALGKAVGATGHLFLYESNPRYQVVLRQNLSANGIANATIMKRASVGTLRRPREPAAEELSPSLDGSAESVDELGLEKLRLLKISSDCDALAVVNGAPGTLWRLRPYVFAAAQSESDCSLIGARLNECGYRSWRMETPLFRVENFNQWPDNVFGNSSAYAVWAIPEEIEIDAPLDGCVEMM